MGSDVILYRCKACGREMGFLEHFSHDHPDFLNDRPTVEFKLCPACRAKADGGASQEDGPH